MSLIMDQDTFSNPGSMGYIPFFRPVDTLILYPEPNKPEPAANFDLHLFLKSAGTILYLFNRS